MLDKLRVLFFACFIIANFYGCASITRSIAETQKQPKLIWNVSYLRGLVLVKEALKTEQIQFENALISKDAANLKGKYADGRTVQIIISKISNFESSVVVQVGASQTAKEDAGKILATIVQYSKQGK